MTARHLSDVEALWRLSEGIRFPGDAERGNLRAFLKRNPGLSHIARVGRRLAGVVLCGHDGRRGYLAHLAVDVSRRGQGIGRSMVARCLDKLRARGIEKCHVLILQDNEAALYFWRRLGWSPRPDVVLMSMDLPAVS